MCISSMYFREIHKQLDYMKSIVLPFIGNIIISDFHKIAIYLYKLIFKFPFYSYYNYEISFLIYYLLNSSCSRKRNIAYLTIMKICHFLQYNYIYNIIWIYYNYSYIHIIRKIMPFYSNLPLIIGIEGNKYEPWNMFINVDIFL